MGHYCWACNNIRPNEAFSGKGHKRHICKRCAQKPREEIEQLQALSNIDGFLAQRNISGKNIAYLEHLSQSSDQEVREKAELVLQIARIRPHKRKRIKFLAHHRPGLLAHLVQYVSLSGQKNIEGTANEESLE